MNSTTRVAVGAIGRALKALDEASTMKESGLQPFGIACWNLSRQLLLAAAMEQDYTVDLGGGYRAVQVERHAKAMGIHPDHLRASHDGKRIFDALLAALAEPQLRKLIVESARRRLAGS